MPIQGAAADLIKKAMIQIHDKLPKISPQTKMILQVHDELFFEVPQKDIAKVKKFVQTQMESVDHQFKCPIKVDIETGQNWGQLK